MMPTRRTAIYVQEEKDESLEKSLLAYAKGEGFQNIVVYKDESITPEEADGFLPGFSLLISDLKDSLISTVIIGSPRQVGGYKGLNLLEDICNRHDAEVVVTSTGSQEGLQEKDIPATGMKPENEDQWGTLREEPILREIVLRGWNPDWREQFESEKARILSHPQIREIGPSILHVGSTSIDELPSKGPIDILVLTQERYLLDVEMYLISDLHYYGHGDRDGRLYLTIQRDENLIFHLHLATSDSKVARDQLLFQTLLRRNLALMKRYAEVKEEAAKHYRDNPKMYTYTKGLFIEGVLSTHRAAQQRTLLQACLRPEQNMSFESVYALLDGPVWMGDAEAKALWEIARFLWVGAEEPEARRRELINMAFKAGIEPAVIDEMLMRLPSISEGC